MAKIPTHFRPKAVSARTGVPAQDPSGAIIAGAVQNLASTFFSGVLELEARAKNLRDASTREKAKGDYIVSYGQEADRIKNANLDNPEEATRLLKETRARLKNEHVDALTDQGLQQEFAFDIDNFNVGEDINDVAWKIKQNTETAKLNYGNRISSDARAMAQTASFEDYIKTIEQFNAIEENPEGVRGLSQAYGGLKEGQEVLEKHMEAVTRARIAGQMARGNSFEEAQRLIRGDYDLFIDTIGKDGKKSVKQELLDKLDQAQKGEAQESAFMRAARASADNFEVAKGLDSGDLDIVGLEEKISDAAFQLSQAEEEGLPADEISILQKGLDVLVLQRDAELKKISLSAVDEFETMGKLSASLQRIVKYSKKKGKTSIRTALDEVLNFQRDATEAKVAGTITADTYKKWMLATEMAIDNDIAQRIKEPGLFGKAFGATGLTAPGGKLSKTRNVRNAMLEILEGIDVAKGEDFAVDVLDFYMDAVNDQLGGDISKLEDMSEITHGELVEHAKRKATLKSKGLPMHTTIGNRIKTPLGLREVVDFRAGDPIINFSDEDILELKRLGVIK
jgi:hypothetical protein